MGSVAARAAGAMGTGRDMGTADKGTGAGIVVGGGIGGTGSGTEGLGA